MLYKVDRMTMAHSVEGRVPFAAPSVLAHAEKLPFRHLIRGDTLKWALREAFRDLLPKDITDRPKHGFNVPLDHWFRGDWRHLVEEAFDAGSALMKTGMFHSRSRERAFALVEDRSRITGQIILPFVILNLWLERRKDGAHR